MKLFLCEPCSIFQLLFSNKAVFTLVRHPACLGESVGVCCPGLCPGVDMKDDVELQRIFFQWAHPNIPNSFSEPRVWGEDGQWLKGRGVNGGGPGRAAPAMFSWPHWRPAESRDLDCVSKNQTLWHLNFISHGAVLARLCSGHQTRKKPVCYQWFVIVGNRLRLFTV